MDTNTAPSRMITIYALCDPDTGDVRYIGQTNQPEKRVRSHMMERMQNPQNPKQVWLDTLREQGKEPVLSVIHVVPDNIADEVEVSEIRKARESGVQLLNTCMGANGGVTKRRTQKKRGTYYANSSFNPVNRRSTSTD